MIDASHLTRRFGALVAVDDVSFHLDQGEVVGFLGPNGAGKTTTLRILAGYLPQTSGSAHVAGFDVLRQSLDVRKHIGYLPESVPLYPEHRVFEMLRFQGRLHGLSRAQMKTRIPEVLERVGILDRERQLIGHLSRGLRQRVGLAVALLPDPEVLILDEPTSGLDPLQRIEVRKLVAELASEHTVLLSSHILPEIEAVCPRVIIIDRGRIAADGTQVELIDALAPPSFVRVEAVVGPDTAQAQGLLEKLPGVQRVDDQGRLGVHHAFDVLCASDVREDVGALAAQKGWALRELSWRRPSLEELFARIALDIERGDERAREPSAAAASPVSGLGELAVLDPTPPAAQAASGRAEPEPRARTIYSLNPFDRGATRDLSRPTTSGPGAADDGDGSGPA